MGIQLQEMAGSVSVVQKKGKKIHDFDIAISSVSQLGESRVNVIVCFRSCTFVNSNLEERSFQRGGRIPSRQTPWCRNA